MRMRIALLLVCVVVLLILLGVSIQVTYADTRWDLDIMDIEKVYDGDTIYVNLDGLPRVFGEDLGIRLRGIDTPEMRSRCDTDEAKARERFLASLAQVALEEKVFQSDVISIRNVSRGSFFRVVGDVYLDDVNVQNWLVEKGYAILESDATPGYWCKSNHLR